VSDLIIHLRLPFQLLLAPIFLWGLLLGGGRIHLGVVAAFALFHVCLYGGATAFNSAYDRDTGPVGGLERPPPVSAGLLPFSIGVLLIGWVACAALSLTLAAVYGAILFLAVAYSHPRLRWKAGPVSSLLTIFVGQGLFGFLGGWVAAGAGVGQLVGSGGLLGALAASLVVAGFYPLTQLFQIEEDRARGDRTVAVAWGIDSSFRLAQAALLAGGAAVAATVLGRSGLGEALLALGFFIALVGAVEAWRRSFDPAAVLVNFRRAMRLNTAAAVALIGYVSWHLART
jgi:1,4-dihydroxy-2-naphthoate octaprenyltransferase